MTEHTTFRSCAACAALPALLVLAGCAQHGAMHTPAKNPKYATLSPDSGRFAVEHTLTVAPPAGAKQVAVWFPLPRHDPAQDVSKETVEAPPGWSETTDAQGNRYVHAVVPASAGKVTVKTSFVVDRDEVNAEIDPSRTRPLTEAETRDLAQHLGSNQHVVVDDAVRELAARIRGSETNPVLVARKLYDWTIESVEYWVKDPARLKASPVGSSTYCLDTRMGNCTDFHSLWTALARASGLPTRMVYGALFKPSLDGKDTDASYHCWPEFFAPELGWIPHDVAVADIFAAPIAIDASNEDRVTLTTATGYAGADAAWADYYFGNLEPRRVTFTHGRDLTLEPPQQAGPVNAVPKGYVEVDGQPFGTFDRKLTFRELR